MREIKFRGFDEENNCWRYGWYARLVEGARAFDAIICFEDDGVLTRYYIHDDSTIGQFTGLTDKNGVEVFEGDIVKSITHFYSELKEIVTVVKFNEVENDRFGEPFTVGYSLLGSEWEIIGNIHEGEQPCTSAIVE